MQTISNQIDSVSVYLLRYIMKHLYLAFQKYKK